MDILLPKKIPVNFDGTERNIIFNIRVTHIIQEHYDMAIGDVISMIYSKEKEHKRKQYENMCYVLMEILNEDTRLYNKENPQSKRENIDADYLYERLNNATANILMDYIVKAFMEMAGNTSEDDSSPNVKSE
jgi:NTP pyrophosphatase (non-canonical NTP hydrolase)